MTQDEIIDMADKAEFVSHGKPSDEESELFVCTDKDIVRFAKLVAERALAEHAMQEVQRLGQEIEQEPVVWADYESKGIHHKPVAWMDADGNVSDNNDHKCFPIPLYTTPPQRTWVGLTDEEMTEIVTDIDVDWGDLLWKVVCLTKIVETKLKERNQ